MIKLRLNSRRLQRLREMFPNGVVTLDSGETIVIIIIADGVLVSPGVTPSVQSFISRVPLSDAPNEPDSESSGASDSDNAQPQFGGGDSRCEDDDRTVRESSSAAVGSHCPEGQSSSDESSESDDSDDSSNGLAQADSRGTGEPPPGSPPASGASDRDGIQAEYHGDAKASPTGAPVGEEGTGRLARQSAPSLPTGEVPIAGVVDEGATENKALNPFCISLRPKRKHGGIFARLSDRESQPSRELVHRARAVFSRMLHGGEGAPGARWNARHIAAKTAGYLRSWNVADRRTEDGRPAILILADVSGSMSAYARVVLKFSLSVARTGLPGGEIIAVAHSNGYPHEVIRGGLRRVDKYGYCDEDDSLLIYTHIIRTYDVRAIVIAADNQGEWVYKHLYACTTAQLYWMHPYCSKRAERVKMVTPDHRFWPRWANPARLRMAYGCGSAKRALEAMERMLIAAP